MSANNLKIMINIYLLDNIDFISYGLVQVHLVHLVHSSTPSNKE